MKMTRTFDAFGNFDHELAFTAAYRQHENAHIAIRETACMDALYPATMLCIREHDLFAGRAAIPLAGFETELNIFFCEELTIRQAMDQGKFDSAYRQRVEEMLTFWRTQSTQAKHDAMMPPETLKATTNAIAHGSPRLAGTVLDYDKLMRLGIPGLLEEIKVNKAKAADAGLFEGMERALKVLIKVCRHYAQQARDMMPAATQQRQAQLQAMAQTLDNITVAAPKSFREGLQLHWLYSLVATVVNHGRMDVSMGDLLTRDLDSGVLTEAQALELLQALWRLMIFRWSRFNTRVVVGGKGRRNPTNADRFALLAMEATRTVRDVVPQLTVRFYKGQNPALMAKALDVIGEGRTFPMLYNDDINVSAVSYCFQIPEEDAAHYIPYGCGEYSLEALSVGSPNCSYNMLKAVEVTIFGGRDALADQPLGLPCAELEAYATYEELFDAYKKQAEYFAYHLVKRHAVELELYKQTVTFPLLTLLYDHCLERGRSAINRGTRYTGAIFESYGMVNAADSLAAIKWLIYDKRLLSAKQLLAALKANFQGYEKEYRLVQGAPRYGNDDDRADLVMKAVSDHAANYFRSLAPEFKLDYSAIVNINNFMNVGLGEKCLASADGRRTGEPLANGNTPTAGRDVSGVTAFLNSIVKPDPRYHAGYVHNMKFSKAMFTRERPKMEMLLNTYFANGGTQAMISVVNRGDLENAMKQPERYGDLIVRVGGFSARFVSLPPEIQRDLLNRTLYE